MRVENRSVHFATNRLYLIQDFVTRRSRYSDLTTLQLYDAKDPRKICGGYAWQHRPDVGELSLVAPSLIRMTLSRGNTYPRSTQHIKSIDPIELYSWEEEFLFVLAHEVRHIDQAWNGDVYTDDEAEEDAERYAIETLKAFRKSQRKLRTARSPRSSRHLRS